MDWNAALSRTEALEGRHREAAALVRFCRALIRFQQEIYRRSKAGVRNDARRLDTALLASFFPDFLQLVEKYGPRELSGQAQKLRDRQDWEEILRSCWKQTEGRMPLLPRAILQPYLLYRAERWHVEVGVPEDGTGSCPFCSRAPLLSVQNGRRTLVCSFCAYEWTFPAEQCPGCHAEKLEFHARKSLPGLRVEACEGCGHYLKGVDLRREPQAVPLVDEMVGFELDEIAREHGFTKFELNLAGQ